MAKIRLKDIDTRAPKQLDKEKTKKELEEILGNLDELQNLLFAESQHSLLVIIQGMDASGKDGVIRNVFGKLNPQELKSNRSRFPQQRSWHMISCGGCITIPPQKESYKFSTGRIMRYHCDKSA
jgi:polyphosphate kinase 2 (PPK2 family)